MTLDEANLHIQKSETTETQKEEEKVKDAESELVISKPIDSFRETNLYDEMRADIELEQH